MSQPPQEQPPQQGGPVFENIIVYLQDSDMDDKGNFNVEPDMPMIVMCQGNYCGYCKQAKPAFAQAARTMFNQALFCTIHFDSENKDERELGHRVGKFVEIPGLPCWFAVGKDGKIKGKYSGDRSAASFEEFARKAIATNE